MYESFDFVFFYVLGNRIYHKKKGGEERCEIKKGFSAEIVR